MAIPMPEMTRIVVTIGVKMAVFRSAVSSSGSAVGEEASTAAESAGTGAGIPEACTMTDETGSQSMLGRSSTCAPMAESVPMS